MRAVRKQRLAVALFVFIGASATVALVMLALQENINLFYEPAKVVGGEAPLDTPIRAGGMVVDGSVLHDDTGLGVRFTLTDYRGHDFDVVYNGILPSLFHEGQGILVAGRLAPDGVFRAREVLAKHDENYVPPELENIAGHDQPGAEITAATLPENIAKEHSLNGRIEVESLVNSAAENIAERAEGGSF